MKKNRGKFFSAIPIILFILLVGLLCSYFSIGLLMVVAVAFLPTVVAMLIDAEEPRFLTKIVASFNALGVTPYIRDILSNAMVDEINNVAAAVLVNPHTWLYVYSVSVLGLVIYFIVPKVVATFESFRLLTQMNRVQEQLSILDAEWSINMNNRPLV